MVWDQSKFAAVDDYIDERDLRRIRDSSWNRSYSSFDEMRKRRPIARFFDTSEPSIAVESFRNIADTKLAMTTSWAPNRIDKRLAASCERLCSTARSFKKENNLDSQVYREGSRIQTHINPIKNRLMNMSHPCLQGKWNSDWSEHAHIAAMKKCRNRVQEYADRRNHEFERVEMNRVQQLQRDKCGEQGMLRRIENELGFIPHAKIEREGIFWADSRMRYELGLNRGTTSPQNGFQVMRMANQGQRTNSSMYSRGVRSVTGC